MKWIILLTDSVCQETSWKETFVMHVQNKDVHVQCRTNLVIR